MDIETQNLLEKFKKLPQTMKEAIVSTDIDNAVLDIAKKHNLLLTEAGQLDNEIVLVLIGEKQASDFIKNIEKEVGLPKETALAVGKDVNETVFENVRKKMKASSENSPDSVNKTVPTQPEQKKVEIKSTTTQVPVAPNDGVAGEAPDNKEKIKEEVAKIPTKNTPPIVPAHARAPSKTPSNDVSKGEKAFLKENISESPNNQSAENQPGENFVSKKLNEQSVAPKTESPNSVPEEVLEETIETEPGEKKKPESGAPDPYREPVD